MKSAANWKSWKLKFTLKVRWMNFGVLLALCAAHVCKIKSNQRWTWYAIERRSGCILAWHNGKRKDKDFLVLWYLLQLFPITAYHTDNWGSYSKYIPANMHRIGKDNTWKIERKNLNFRTHTCTAYLCTLGTKYEYKTFEPENHLLLEKRTDT